MQDMPKRKVRILIIIFFLELAETEHKQILTKLQHTSIKRYVSTNIKFKGKYYEKE